MDLNITWFVLYGVLLSGYAILDGFDLGVGVLHLFAKNNEERRLGINSIAPVWDGNEVWLLTAGGALFAAFPRAYGTIFSSFYLALVLVLAGLIFRAVSMEFRGKVDSELWRRFWDWAFGLGSLLPSILFGVAVANILRGIPLDDTGTFTGGFFGLLNPFALVGGLVSLTMFTMHGAIYMCVKTEGDLQKRVHGWIGSAWMAFVVFLVIGIGLAFFQANHLIDGIFGKKGFWILLLPLLGSIVYIPVAAQAKKYLQAFVSSAIMIFSVIFQAGVCLFPRMLPSTTDLANSLTIYNASSTPKTLTVMLIIALIGMPLVIGYTIFIYKIFKGKVVLDEHSY